MTEYWTTEGKLPLYRGYRVYSKEFGDECTIGTRYEPDLDQWPSVELIFDDKTIEVISTHNMIDGKEHTLYVFDDLAMIKPVFEVVKNES